MEWRRTHFSGKIAASFLAYLCFTSPPADAGALKAKQLEELWSVDGPSRDTTIKAIIACLETLNTPQGETGGKALGANKACKDKPNQISFLSLNRRPAIDQRQTLASLGQLLNRPEARQINLRIVGHATCREVSLRDPYAMKLTLKRAKAIGDLLARSGRVDGDRLIAEGRGYFEPLETEKSQKDGKPDQDACKVGTPYAKNARVEFAIDTPIGLTYGLAAGQDVSALGGGDPLPRPNQSPRDKAPAAAAAAAAVPASPTAIRYFPAGLRPGPIFSISLSRAVAHFRINPSTVTPSSCAGYRTAWQVLPEISNLDKGAGTVALRLRTALVRSEDQNRQRDHIELFLDIDGREERKGSGPAFAGHWAMRERAVLALRLAMTGSAYRSQTSAALDRQAGWGTDAEDGKPATPADFVRNCGFKGDAENSDTASWSEAQSAYDHVIAALPATPEDLLARRLELNSLQGFVALRAGYQLCISPAGAAVKQDGNERGEITFQLAFAPQTCAIAREFTFATGRTGLTVGGGTWRVANEITMLPSLDKNENRVVVTRWRDLVDPSRSSRAYLFSARKFLPAYMDQWILGTLNDQQANNTNHADYLLGIRNPAPPNSSDLGLFFADRFLDEVDEACIGGSGKFKAVPLPGTYQRLRPADLYDSGQAQGLITSAKTAYTRCATAERFAEITANLPIRVRDEPTFVPIGTTWGELASEHRTSGRNLYKGAASSVAAEALFGERARAATFSQGAARALPILPGDSIGW
ncbi:hypothetical protein EGJ28_15155 [Stutzerimonas xanthomarina]|uniref:OmpA-like domain-containing protein n=1 Tax=Stutzerimonas xanthomarina TaxID=271420 RepID=A0A3R8W8X1_9GAMM|nr:OmpA family protein [Stutzerimonas xanthomarina]RRV10023.1 hypothetical protein EGJ28_15155 [Stutzerimonas xanthomarina]